MDVLAGVEPGEAPHQRREMFLVGAAGVLVEVEAGGEASS
jgi:hypothetical protein